MKIYIAGAITGNKNFREKFDEAEKFLSDNNHFPINPCHGEGFEYREYIDMGLCLLMKCDAIYLLDGWEDSKGACLEKMYAETVGINIYKERDSYALTGTSSVFLKGK